MAAPVVAISDTQFLRALPLPRYLKMVRDAAESFLGFVILMHPQWKLEPFQLELIDLLDRLEKGKLTNAKGEPIYRVMINMPPRFAKSTIATILFPAWYILRNTTRKVMTGSYSGNLAVGFGKQVRDLVEHPRSRQAFPHAHIDPKSRAVDAWSLVDGQGQDTSGRYFAVGMGGQTTGRPANLLIVDDPVKTKEEVDSPTMRNKVWDFYEWSLKIRKEPNMLSPGVWEKPIEIVILTRWHPDDLGGRIQETADWKNGEWEHVKFQAVTKNAAGQDVSLWEERFPVVDLLKLKSANAQSFEALYQQEPFVAGGGMIKSKWFQEFSKPLERADRVVLIAGCDTGQKAEEHHDPSVMLFASLGVDGNYYIENVVRGRWEYPDLKRQFVVQNARQKGTGFRGFYVEDKASGIGLVQDLRKMPGISVIAHKMLGDKATKTRTVLPLIEGGLVYLPEEAPWKDDFLKECEKFTGAKGGEDDQVDAMTIALDVLSRMSMPDSTSFHTSGQSIEDMVASLNNGSGASNGAWNGWGE